MVHYTQVKCYICGENTISFNGMYGCFNQVNEESQLRDSAHRAFRVCTHVGRILSYMYIAFLDLIAYWAVRLCLSMHNIRALDPFTPVHVSPFYHVTHRNPTFLGNVVEHVCL